MKLKHHLPLLILTIFTSSCTSLNFGRSPAGVKTHVITNTEIRSEDSAILDETIPLDHFNSEFAYDLRPDVKNENVIWHGIAGSYADWCRDQNDQVKYEDDGNTIEVKICEKIGTKLPEIRNYISTHRKEITDLKAIPHTYDRVTTYTGIRPEENKEIVEAQCTKDDESLDEFDFTYTCRITYKKQNLKSLLLGLGRYQNEKIPVFSIMIEYRYFGSSHRTEGNNLNDAILVLDEAEWAGKRGHSFYNFTYKR